MERKGLLGFYNYTVVLTYIGMLAGFNGIIFLARGMFYQAIICLMAAGFCDMFDGAIASTMKRTKQEKCFGIQIDSLSDLICFGVLPATLVICMNDFNKIAIVAGSFYALCALIRLSYFNVDEQERQDKTDEHRSVYYGLPVTTSAVIYPLMYGIAALRSINISVSLICAAFFMGTMFLAPVKLKKPGALGKAAFVVVGFIELYLVIKGGM